jgi:hypothetical protein
MIVFQVYILLVFNLHESEVHEITKSEQISKSTRLSKESIHNAVIKINTTAIYNSQVHDSSVLSPSFHYSLSILPKFIYFLYVYISALNATYYPVTLSPDYMFQPYMATIRCCLSS